MLVVWQNWFRGLVHELHVVVIVSQVPVFVCKQLRKTVMWPTSRNLWGYCQIDSQLLLVLVEVLRATRDALVTGELMEVNTMV